MNFKQFIEDTSKVAKSIIERVESYKNLKGQEKKARVDEVVTKYVTEAINVLQLNFVAKFVLKKVLIENIPTITQVVFNLIETRITGITGKE